MSESVAPDESTDLLWGIAEQANEAFDRRQTVSALLQAVQLLRKTTPFEVPGVNISPYTEPDLQQRYEEAQRRFADCLAQAPDKEPLLPPLPEGIIDYGSPFVYDEEFKRLATFRGYHKNIPRRAFGALLSESHTIEVKDPAAYQSPRELPEGAKGKLIKLRIKQPNGKLTDALDRAWLLNFTSDWHKDPPDFSNFGPICTSFVMDHYNHASRTPNPLPLDAPPTTPEAQEVQRQARVTALKELPPQELLMDSITLPNEGKVAVVTCESLKRYALTVLPKDAGPLHLATLFQSLWRQMYGPETRIRHLDTAYRINLVFVYVPENEMRSYSAEAYLGINPRFFVSAIRHWENTSYRAPGYTSRAQEVLGTYIPALEELLLGGK